MDQPIRPLSTMRTPVASSSVGTGRRRGRQPRYDPMTVLDAIDAYQRSNNLRSPSQRRLQTDLGVSAPSVVHMILHRLSEAKLLTIKTYGRGFGADLTLTEVGQAALLAWRSQHGSSNAS